VTQLEEEIVENLTMSRSLTLNKNKKVEHYIRIKTHFLNVFG